MSMSMQKTGVVDSLSALLVVDFAASDARSLEGIKSNRPGDVAGSCVTAGPRYAAPDQYFGSSD